MITLVTLLIIAGFISWYNIYTKCKKIGISFDIFEAGFANYMFCVFGTMISILTTFYLIINYLP